MPSQQTKTTTPPETKLANIILPGLRDCSIVSEKGKTRWLDLMRNFTATKVETCRQTSRKFKGDPRLKSFTTGSTDEGSWGTTAFRGTGCYSFAGGEYTYAGEFENGQFHGKGEFIYPGGVRLKGTFDKGVMKDQEVTFPGGLKYPEKDWVYCNLPDRRFSVEYTEGLRGADQCRITPDDPPLPVPEGHYDTFYGFLESENEFVMKRDNLDTAISAPTQRHLQWIRANCRYALERTVGPIPQLYEKWQEPTLEKPVCPRAAALTEDRSSHRLDMYDESEPTLEKPMCPRPAAVKKGRSCHNAELDMYDDDSVELLTKIDECVGNCNTGRPPRDGLKALDCSRILMAIGDTPKSKQIGSVSEDGKARYLDLLRNFTASNAQKCRYVNQKVPLRDARLKIFPTGSNYEGAWSASSFKGYGNYMFPSGNCIYMGEFENGLFHGIGELVYPDGSTLQGTFKEGHMEDRHLIFSNGLEYTEDNWKYCKKPDRRFTVEYTYDLQPEPECLITPDYPPLPVPDGYYDVIYGILDPVKKTVVRDDDLSIISAPTEAELKWMKRHCRSAEDPSRGPMPDVYEKWTDPELELPMPPPPAAMTDLDQYAFDDEDFDEDEWLRRKSTKSRIFYSGLKDATKAESTKLSEAGSVVGFIEPDAVSRQSSRQTLRSQISMIPQKESRHSSAHFTLTDLANFKTKEQIDKIFRSRATSDGAYTFRLKRSDLVDLSLPDIQKHTRLKKSKTSDSRGDSQSFSRTKTGKSSLGSVTKASTHKNGQRESSGSQIKFRLSRSSRVRMDNETLANQDSLTKRSSETLSLGTNRTRTESDMPRPEKPDAETAPQAQPLVLQREPDSIRNANSRSAIDFTQTVKHDSELVQISKSSSIGSRRSGMTMGNIMPQTEETDHELVQISKSPSIANRRSGMTMSNIMPQTEDTDNELVQISKSPSIANRRSGMALVNIMPQTEKTENDLVQIAKSSSIAFRRSGMVMSNIMSQTANTDNELVQISKLPSITNRRSGLVMDNGLPQAVKPDYEPAQVASRSSIIGTRRSAIALDNIVNVKLDNDRVPPSIGTRRSGLTINNSSVIMPPIVNPDNVQQVASRSQSIGTRRSGIALNSITSQPQKPASEILAKIQLTEIAPTAAVKSKSLRMVSAVAIIERNDTLSNF